MEEKGGCQVIGAALEKKRRSLGMSYARAGRFLGVSWATVRNWEKGSCAIREPRDRVRLSRFISGSCDSWAAEVLDLLPEKQALADIPPELGKVLAGLYHSYMDCQCLPGSDDFFRSHLDKLSAEVLGSFFTDRDS